MIFHVTFEEEDMFDVRLGQDENVDLSLGEVSVIHSPPYEGSYIVTPEFAEQILYTENKEMTQNVCVLEIPYSEVTNPSGGLTINIGGPNG